MNEPDINAHHETIFKRTRERIEVAYEKATKYGFKNPVAVVLDLNDDFAREIAGTSGLHERIDDTVAEALYRGVVPIAVWHLPGDFAAKLLARFPGVAAKLGEPSPQGTFYTVLVAAADVSLVLTPCP